MKNHVAMEPNGYYSYRDNGLLPAKKQTNIILFAPLKNPSNKIQF